MGRVWPGGSTEGRECPPFLNLQDMGGGVQLLLMGIQGHMTLGRAWPRPGQRVTDLQEESEVEAVTRTQTSQTDREGGRGQ